MKENLGKTLAVLTLLYVLVFFGPRKFTDWRVDYESRMAEVRAKAKEKEEAKNGPRFRVVRISTEWSENIHEMFKLQNGEYVDWVNTSTGTKLQVLVNDQVVLSQEDHYNNTDCYSLRVRVDPFHHAPDTVAYIRVNKHTN